MAHSKRGVSALKLARHLSASERTADFVMLKVRATMLGAGGRPGRCLIRVVVDCSGGTYRGFARGRVDVRSAVRSND